jgi:hypothetical protein
MTDSKSKRLELRQGFERTDLTFSIAKPLPGLPSVQQMMMLARTMEPRLPE